ncbi:MAG: serine/threonine protein kinase [Betaproteobacteria bacterium]|nr:serine/threonine protein kinase [Betaproteobacteria bacterium]
MARIRQISVVVEERSQIAEVRREAAALGTAAGFGSETAGKLALAVTETATNIVKHGSGGRIFARTLDAGASSGVEIVAVDRGTGMRDIASGMQDGYSTAGTPGNGLGSIKRMTSGFEIYSQPGKGTCSRFEVWADVQPKLTDSWGVATVPKPGEVVCGDTCAITTGEGSCDVLVVDGLGHGPQAAIASQTAADLLSALPPRDPAAMIEEIHAAIAGTRGGAGAVASVDWKAGAGKFCGIGNIAGLVYSNYKARQLMSHNGTLGHNARKIQQFEFDFPPAALLIMASDGLTTHWTLDDYPGLVNRHPAIIAAVLFRDHSRQRDDTSVLVLRNPAN